MKAGANHLGRQLPGSVQVPVSVVSLSPSQSFDSVVVAGNARSVTYVDGNGQVYARDICAAFLAFWECVALFAYD
ncbi:unnamed protein product [Notodromas monacha]|uniref:Uncharacterized protein n=1 Tax=Notodromas monacha TaxID=399045 RepID=A0A7R9BK66_9CRUS|nr:unnamed protein product [Notodromas monacha]CAG0916990.1 unnamed protein product [Notodromas monacha]